MTSHTFTINYPYCPKILLMTSHHTTIIANRIGNVYNVNVLTSQMKQKINNKNTLTLLIQLAGFDEYRPLYHTYKTQ